MDPTCTLLHLGFLWDTMKGTLALLEEVETWAKKLLVAGSTTQEDLESFVGTLTSTHTAIWMAPLQLRYLQRFFLFSLKQGRYK